MRYPANITFHPRVALGLALGFASVLLSPAPAEAQDPTLEEREQQAAAHREAGRAHFFAPTEGDPEGLEKCARAYLDIYDDFPDHTEPDRLLWNAADCWDGAYRIEEANQVRELLLARHPDSNRARDTLRFLGESYGAIAAYAPAAAAYETFAERYPKDGDTPDVLRNAYLFRLGLDQKDAAGRVLDEYERLYQKRDIPRAAGILWTKHDLLESWQEQREHALGYLERYGTKGGTDRAVVAEAVVAQIDWRRSCRKPLLLDSCITVERKRPARPLDRRQPHPSPIRAEKATKVTRYRPPERCGVPAQAIITVHRRDAKLSAAAQKRFAYLQKMISHSKPKIPADDPERIEAYQSAEGMSRFYLADAKYEDYLRIEPPEKLDFTLDEWREDSGVPAWEQQYHEQLIESEASRERLREFHELKIQLGTELRDMYAKIEPSDSLYWHLAGLMRMAALDQHYADQLHRAKLPRHIRSEEQVGTYCDTLATLATSVEQAARSVWGHCLDRSTEFQYFNEFSTACEAEATARDPERHPAMHELFGEPGHVENGIKSVGLLADPGDHVDLTEAEPD